MPQGAPKPLLQPIADCEGFEHFLYRRPSPRGVGRHDGAPKSERRRPVRVGWRGPLRRRGTWKGLRVQTSTVPAVWVVNVQTKAKITSPSRHLYMTSKYW